jgi:hypothetical protein
MAQRFSAAITTLLPGAASPAEVNFSARNILILLIPLILTASSLAVTKPHVISFGKWLPVQWTPATNGDDKPLSIKIRPLIVDGRVKEYVTGAPHEITERLFVVRRIFRVNDSLPDDSTPKWQWQRGGWLLVDRLTGRVSPLNLPEFDVVYSAAAWYRDYIAYCGVSDDGNKRFAIVAELSRRKPVLKKPLSGALPDDAAPDSACPAPTWQRTPTRVTFEAENTKQTFAIRGHVVDLVDDTDEEEGN